MRTLAALFLGVVMGAYFSPSLRVPTKWTNLEDMTVCQPVKPVIVDPSDALLFMLQKTYDGYNLCIDELDSSTKECVSRIETLNKKCKTF